MVEHERLVPEVCSTAKIENVCPLYKSIIDGKVIWVVLAPNFKEKVPLFPFLWNIAKEEADI